MSKRTVKFLIIAVVACVLLWDAWLYADGDIGNSISQVIIAWSKGSRIFTAFLGAVFGFLFSHFFDDEEKPHDNPSN